MAASGFSHNVEQFVLSHISSVEQLELLLLLHRSTPKHWTAITASHELRLDTASVARRLSEFEERGMIETRSAGAAQEFWYEPSSVAPERALAELERAYRERRTSLINLIFSTPEDDGRGVADAGRLRNGRD